jgi:hypothetical protein
MRKSTLVWLAVCVALVAAWGVALSACQGGDGRSTPAARENPPGGAGQPGEVRYPPGPTRPDPVIWMEPVDLATATGKTLTRIGIDNLGGPVSAELLDALAAETSLRTWPDMGEVAAEVVAIPSGSGVGADTRAYVEVRPRDALASGWHVLRVARLPVGLAAPRFPAHVTLPDGSIGARFRPDSWPTVVSIRVCERDTGVQTVIADFSERMLIDAGDAAVLTVENSGAVDSACSTVGGEGTGEGVGDVATTCSGLRASEVVNVSLAAGLVSVGGGLLREPAGSAGLSFSFVPDTLAEWGVGCRRFVPGLL